MSEELSGEEKREIQDGKSRDESGTKSISLAFTALYHRNECRHIAQLLLHGHFSLDVNRKSIVLPTTHLHLLFLTHFYLFDRFLPRLISP